MDFRPWNAIGYNGTIALLFLYFLCLVFSGSIMKRRKCKYTYICNGFSSIFVLSYASKHLWSIAILLRLFLSNDIADINPLPIAG